MRNVLRIAYSVFNSLRNTKYGIRSPVLFQAAVLLIAGLAAWPIWGQLLSVQPGLLNTRGGGDSPFLLQRLQQLTAALADGHFPVRWMPDANYGYGYPFYNFYAPLSIYIAAVFRLLQFSFVRSILLAQAAGFVVAAGATYQLGRRWFGSEWAGLLASAAYTLAPFHLVNIYVRGDSLAEFWAMAFYPLALLAVDNLRKSQISSDKDKGTRGQGDKESSIPYSVFRIWKQKIDNRLYAVRSSSKVALLALVFAALVLSHNISALIFTPFLLLFVILPQSRGARFGNRGYENGWRLGFGIWDLGFIFAVFLGLLLALALSAWFWWPALAERSLAQLGPVTAGYFHYSNHFRGLDLVQSSLFFDYDVAGGRAFRMGLVQAIVAMVGLGAFFIGIRPNVLRIAYSVLRVKQYAIRNTQYAPLLFILLSLLIATFMITPLSRPLWNSLPLLPFTQFPWRFLSVQALAGALATAGLALLPGRKYVVPAVVGLLLVAALGRLRPDYLPLTDEDVTAERLAQYEWFTGNIGSTVSAEYLPPAVAARPYTSSWLNTGERFQLRAVAGELTSYRKDDWQATEQVWQVSAGDGGATVMLPTLYWPGWRAEVDGAAAELQAAAGSGLMMLAIPAGEHEVHLWLGRTPVRLAAEIVSLVALLVTGLAFVGRFGKSPTIRWLFWVAAALAFYLFLPKSWMEEQLSRSTLTWDFAEMGYLHHALYSVPIEQGAVLGYSYSEAYLTPGEAFSVTLRLLDPAGRPVVGDEGGSRTAPTMGLVTPAVNRFPDAPELTSAEGEQTAGQMVFRLVIPANAPPGLYIPRLDGWTAYTPAGRPRGNLFLRPIRILPTGEITAIEDGSTLRVRVEEVSQRDEGTLDVQVAWWTERPLSQPYNVSLRLTDAAGLQLAQFDSQPGYGFLPSMGWPAGEWVNDWLALPLPADLEAAKGPFGLTVRLYEVGTGTAVLTRRLGELEWGDEGLAFRPTEPVFEVPAGVTRLEATFGDVIGLRGYRLEQTADALRLTLYWEALTAGQVDYSHFVHLVDPATGEIVAQHDAMPGNNSYPTGQWTAGEIVADSITLDISEVAAGRYDLAVGLYERVGDSFPRLVAADGEGRRLADDKLVLPAGVEIKE